MIKSTILLHSIWALAAVATFLFGWYLPREADAPALIESAQAGRERPSIDGFRSNPKGSKSVVFEGGTHPGGPVESGFGMGLPARGTPLSRAQLADLTEVALKHPNMLKRNLAFSRLLESMTGENAPDILEEMKKTRAGSDQWRLFRYAWGAIDGAGAMQHAATLEGKERRYVIDSTLNGWASADPAGAKAWLATVADPEERSRYQHSLVGGLADRDTNEATRYVYDLAASGDKQAIRHISTVAGEELRRNGAEIAAAWATSLPDGPLKGEALDEVGGRYVARDPAAAAAWAEQFAAADYGRDVIEEVGEEWAERDPLSAVNWLQSLEDGKPRTAGMYSALREWGRRDALAASEHLDAMPASDSRDSAVSGFVRAISERDPQSASIWAATIDDESRRTETLSRSMDRWIRRDPEAASAWLPQSGLPVQTQDKLRRAAASRLQRN